MSRMFSFISFCDVSIGQLFNFCYQFLNSQVSFSVSLFQQKSISLLFFHQQRSLFLALPSTTLIDIYSVHEAFAITLLRLSALVRSRAPLNGLINLISFLSSLLPDYQMNMSRAVGCAVHDWIAVTGMIWWNFRMFYVPIELPGQHGTANAI